MSDLTYGDLRTKLKRLGFTEQRFQSNGKRGRIYEQHTKNGASLMLPEREDALPVERFYLSYVLAVLRSHGIVEEQNPLLNS